MRWYCAIVYCYVILLFHLLPQNPWAWILVGVGIGVLSSTLGIGGGELMGPLMLALQVMPQVRTCM